MLKPDFHQGSALKHLVVAKYNEDLGWLREVPEDWEVHVVDNSPCNYPGREAYCYLYAIVQHYGVAFMDAEAIVFCQGNPFHHDEKFLEHLETHTEFGMDWSCDSIGKPDCNYVQMDEYCSVFGLPVQERYGFVAGAQFKVTGAQIHRRPLAFYKSLLALTQLGNKSAWTLERMWRLIFPAMKTVLIFVLSAHIPPYEEMIATSMRTWDAYPVDGTRTVFYCGNPMSMDTDRVINFPVDEDYKTIGHKDLLAYQWALFHSWDYMARVNASCYVHKRRLLEHVQGLPSTGVMRGAVSAPTPFCGVNRPFMWGGAQFIISRDVVEAFVRNKERWRHDVMEDVAMSELAQDCGFEIDQHGLFCSIGKEPDGWSAIAYNGHIAGFEFKDFADVARLDDQFFFRCKHDPDRRVDAEIMTLLSQHLPT